MIKYAQLLLFIQFFWFWNISSFLASVFGSFFWFTELVIARLKDLAIYVIHTNYLYQLATDSMERWCTPCVRSWFIQIVSWKSCFVNRTKYFALWRRKTALWIIIVIRNGLWLWDNFIFFEQVESNTFIFIYANWENLTEACLEFCQTPTMDLFLAKIVDSWQYEIRFYEKWNNAFWDALY